MVEAINQVPKNPAIPPKGNSPLLIIIPKGPLQELLKYLKA